MAIVIAIAPVPKPRMSRSDKWNSRPCCEQYWQFKDELRSLIDPDEFPHPCHITFVIPMPRSWSEKKKRRYDGTPHQQKPDWDNLAKGLTDALFDEDKHLYDVWVTKIWGREGQIVIEEMQNTGEKS